MDQQLLWDDLQSICVQQQYTNMEGILLIRSMCIFLNEIDQSNKKPLK